MAPSDLSCAVKDCKHFDSVFGDSVPDSIIANEEFPNLLEINSGTCGLFEDWLASA